MLPNETHDAFAFGHFDLAILLDAFAFDGIGPFLASQGDDYLPLFVFFLNLQFFFGSDSSGFGFQQLFRLNPSSLGLLTRFNGRDFSSLLFNRFDALLFQFQNGFLSFHVLLLQRFFFFASEEVFLHLFGTP